MFNGRRNIHSQGFIAIDDITVKEGACSNQSMYTLMQAGVQNIEEIVNHFAFFFTISDLCGFDSDTCGFENRVSLLGHWERRKGTKNHVDHTYGTENGECRTLLQCSCRVYIATEQPN